MDVIFTVSPDYLNILEEETRKYSFGIQGYRDIEVAMESLYLSNSKDILGFAYVADELPDPKLMRKFIRKIDLTVTRPTKLILAIRNQESFEEFRQSYRGSRVIIESITGFEVLTDLIINNSIIGTILKTRYKPYLDDMPDNTRVFPTTDHLKYTKVIDKRLLGIIRGVRLLTSVEDTIKFDEVLSRLTNKEGLYYKLRVAYIKAHFGIETDISALGTGDRFVIIKVLEHMMKEVSRNARKK